jgi:hypothetical protein
MKKIEQKRRAYEYAYDLNDKVDVNGKVYISTKDGNMDNPLTQGAAWEMDK